MEEFKMNRKGQGGMEYLILLGGIVILVAVSIVVMGSIGGGGTSSAGKARDIFESQISEAEGPKASFDTSIGNSGGPAPITVEFTDTSTTPNENIDSRNWDFGNGETAEGEEVTTTFTQNIPYLVILEVTDNKGRKSTARKTISIDTYPIAAFDWERDNGVPDLKKIIFTDESTQTGAAIVSWEWDFGDGEFSGEQDPEHTYTGGYGIKIVTLTVTDGDGFAKSVSENAITGGECGNGIREPDLDCSLEINYDDPGNPIQLPGCFCDADCSCSGGMNCCSDGSCYLDCGDII